MSMIRSPRRERPAGLLGEIVDPHLHLTNATGAAGIEPETTPLTLLLVLGLYLVNLRTHAALPTCAVHLSATGRRRQAKNFFVNLLKLFFRGTPKWLLRVSLMLATFFVFPISVFCDFVLDDFVYVQGGTFLMGSGEWRSR